MLVALYLYPTPHKLVALNMIYLYPTTHMLGVLYMKYLFPTPYMLVAVYLLLTPICLLATPYMM